MVAYRFKTNNLGTARPRAVLSTLHFIAGATMLAETFISRRLLYRTLDVQGRNARDRITWRSAGAAFALGFVGLILQTGSHCFAQEAPEAASLRMSERVDELLQQHLQDIGWKSAEPCDDAAFLRRVHLDLTGTPPTGSETIAFVDDDFEAKDQRVIDQLLESPTCAAHLAGQWSRWMLPEDNANPFVPANSGLRNWLRDRFAENLRYDRLVADLMVSSGPVQAGPTEFFVALEVKPEKIAAKTARVFMGVQLDCAECHDHPFDEWSQKDFWGFAAYFAQLSGNSEQPVAMRAGEISDSGEGEVTLPGTEEVVPPKPLVKTGLSGLSRGTRRQQPNALVDGEGESLSCASDSQSRLGHAFWTRSH